LEAIRVAPASCRPSVGEPAGSRRTFKASPASRLLQLAIVALTLASSGLAHPIHRSIAEANYNRTTQTLEVALRVFADDFQDALGAHAKKKISFEKTPAADLDRLIEAYLAERFTIKTVDGATAKLRWLGRELKDAENELWLYFEAPLPTRIEGIKIWHRMLSEHFRDQLNSVVVRDGTRKVTLVFLASHGEKAVRFPH
jgi:hypothetical protein